ncbi:MAG: ThiF family adenylyltransferase, partial [Muribaculaceae bacterium]|nr:ThiF family adenylyltransferase [Muribaculaceae bacterium]
NKFIKGKKRKPIVCYPSPIENKDLELWGYHFDDTNYYNVVGVERPSSDMGGVSPVCLGHFYKNKPNEPRNELYGYYSHKDLKMGSKILKTYDYLQKFGTLSIISSNCNVMSVNSESNKLQAITIGTSEIKFYDGDSLLETIKVEVVDNPSKEVSADTLKVIIGETFYCYIEDCPTFVDKDGCKAELEPVKLKIDIFSRNTGILESDIMLKKGAVIIGCGSVGSLIALELARAGVGHFFLIDMDILGYHNICRHQCGIQDVGKFKTTAVKERILQINPIAEVITANKMIQEVDMSLLETFCNKDVIMIGCADNREGDLYGNQFFAKPNGMPFISIGCWERAFAGEIFYCLPEGMPDYSDFVTALGESSGRVNANTHIYMGEVGSFEPGISADINFVTIIAVKMILDLLNRDNEAYTQRLIYNLSQYTLICNTNNPKIGGDMTEIFSYPLQVTTSIEVEYANPHVESNS